MALQRFGLPTPCAPRVRSGPGRSHTAGQRGQRARGEYEAMEPLRDVAQLPLQFMDQIQWRYEVIRPLVLLDEGTPTQRAEETHTHPDTVRTWARRFRQQGMLGLVPGSVEVVPRGRPTGDCPAQRALCGVSLS
jgi:hypothetical protein